MQERGFSLIELLIVVAIILVICAIAVPNFLHSRIAANESSAVYSIRTINTAQVTYQSTYPTVGYATALSLLASPASGPASSNNAGILDSVLGCTSSVCSKSGYNFSLADISGSPVSAYSVWGVPISLGNSGYRTFCSNNMNPVLFDPSGGPVDSGNCNQALQ